MLGLLHHVFVCELLWRVLGASALKSHQGHCGVLCCHVPMALLLQGNGRDVYPKVQINGRAVSRVRVPYVSVWFTPEKGESGNLNGAHPATPGGGDPSVLDANCPPN